METSAKKKEIFCYGLRNPWRFSFDRLNNDLIIGDIGQNLWEEINWTSWENAKGANFGWNIMEGNHCYDSESFCDTSGITTPIHEYPNNGAYLKILIGMDDKEATGCSVTGGYVYRGRKNSYWGTYIFGDYCAGKIWSFKLIDGKVSSISYIDRETKQAKILKTDGVFVQIGLVPNSHFLNGIVALNEYGEIIIDDRGRTSEGGIFACGDATNVPYKQISISMGEGAKAAIAAAEFLQTHSVNQ